MKKISITMLGFAAAICMALVVQPIVAALVSTVSQPVVNSGAPKTLGVVNPRGQVVLAGIKIDGVANTGIIDGVGMIELYNRDSNDLVDMSQVEVVVRFTTTEPNPADLLAPVKTDYRCGINISGYLRPEEYVTYSNLSAAQYYQVPSQCQNIGKKLDGSINIQLEQKNATDNPFEKVDMTAANMGVAYERKGFTSTYLTGLMNDFKALARPLQGRPLYEPPAGMPLRILEINMRPKVCASSDTRLECKKYVKVANPSSAMVPLELYRLRAGQSSYYTTNIAGAVPAGGFAVIYQDTDGGEIVLNSTDGTVWFDDFYGVKAYGNNDAPYADAELAANNGKSWAYDSSDGAWKWAKPSPYTEENAFYTAEELAGCAAGETFNAVTSECEKPIIDTRVPCRDDQYRSEETGRCRSIVQASDAPAPCKEGQYRSEETNRCRSVISGVASILQPCGADQFRNPATGRCKKIASLEDIVQPCDAGYERNPETNRCRKIRESAMPNVGYAVKQAEQQKKDFVGWWALAGVVALGLGYALWEWRHELWARIRILLGK